MVLFNTLSLSCLSVFLLLLLRPTLADKDCCYLNSNGFGLVQFQISWVAATQSATCAITNFDGTLYTCAVNVTMEGAFQKAAAIATFASTTPVHTLNMTVGMNNNDCSILGDGQVPRGMDPSYLWAGAFGVAPIACDFRPDPPGIKWS